ncbi:hypothetical protein Dimus_000679 [Dionaea muscipula]
MHVDACEEFYARLTMSHYKKKEVARSSVRGFGIELDNERLALILGIPGNNGICEYIKEVWEESKYTKPLEITRNFTNDNTIMEARRNQLDFDWEEVVDEAALQRESGLDDQFFDAQVEVEESAAVVEEVPEEAAHALDQQKETEAAGVDPSAPTGSIPDAIFSSLQADFERARANRI